MSRLILALALGLLLACPVGAQDRRQPQALIRVTVQNEAGGAVAGGVLRLVHRGGWAMDYVDDGDGRWTFWVAADAGAGLYQVRCTPPVGMALKGPMLRDGVGEVVYVAVPGRTVYAANWRSDATRR